MSAAASNDIWIFVDLRSRRFFDYSLNAVCKARQLAASTAGKAVACLLTLPSAGAPPARFEDEACVLPASAETECQVHGADQVLVLENSGFDPPRDDLYAPALAEATGQPPEFIAQVEAEEISPPVSFLLGLAGALGVDPGTFLRKEEQASIRDRRLESYVRRTQNYYYQTLTEGGAHDHLRAFLVTIEPHQTHKPVAYKHEGEEFV